MNPQVVGFGRGWLASYEVLPSLPPSLSGLSKAPQNPKRFRPVTSVSANPQKKKGGEKENKGQEKLCLLASPPPRCVYIVDVVLESEHERSAPPHSLSI